MEYSPVGPIARKTELTVENLPSETVVYDHQSHCVHCLNQSTSLIWQQCDGQTTIEDMAARLSEAGLPPDLEIVKRALKHLNRAHLLTDQPAFVVSDLPSRRNLISRLGLAAGAAGILLPTIKSKAAPSAAQAKSGDQPPKYKPPKKKR